MMMSYGRWIRIKPMHIGPPVRCIQKSATLHHIFPIQPVSSIRQTTIFPIRPFIYPWLILSYPYLWKSERLCRIIALPLPTFLELWKAISMPQPTSYLPCNFWSLPLNSSRCLIDQENTLLIIYQLIFPIPWYSNQAYEGSHLNFTPPSWSSSLAFSFSQTCHVR